MVLAHPPARLSSSCTSPASLFFLWYGVSSGLSLLASAALFAVGVFVWTLLEYLIHRFSFHYTPRGRIGMFYAYMIHGVHHAFPEDDRRWLVPSDHQRRHYRGDRPAPALAVARHVIRLAYAGGMIGYLIYDLSHYAMHRGPSQFEFFNTLRRRHMQHHYATPERWYGVSTPLWDHVFGTTVPERRGGDDRNA